MEKKLYFISDTNDLSLLQNMNGEIFSFDYKSHKKLQELKIEHQIAEDFLNYDERVWVFDQAKKFSNWYNNPIFRDFKLKNVNLLGLFDSMEFHTLLMEKLIIFLTIKKILDERSPTMIECSLEMSKMIKILNEKINVTINTVFKEKELFWDSVNIKHNIGGKPLSMKISRTKFNKLKNILDKTVGSTMGLWFDFKNKHKKTILLLEMYPPTYKDLFNELKNRDYNIIIINRRRPVTLERESIKILKNSNCKLISEDKLYEKNDLDEISSYQKEFFKKIDVVWDEDEKFQKIFEISNFSFWEIIKDELREVFKRRINEYVKLVIFAEKIFEKINVKNIISLYESGETEKAFLNKKPSSVNSFLLEHGFSLLFKENKTFGFLSSYDKFTDNITVWSNFQKDFLINNYNIKKEKIFAVGSPRHDIFTRMKKIKKNNTKIVALIAPTPITQLQGFDITRIHEKFEHTIEKLSSELQKRGIDIIFKIHPSQSAHNDETKEIIEKYAKNSPIYFLNPTIDLIQSCDIVISITPEGWCPSTILLESMILGKPTLNVVLDDKFYDFEYIKNEAVISISPDQIENEINKLTNDSVYREKISKNAIVFTKEFLCNYGRSTEFLANLLIDN